MDKVDDNGRGLPPLLTPQPDEPVRFEFGRWTFQIDTGDLNDGTSTTRLEPQVAKLLAYFLAHQQVVISRDELMAAVWEHRIVSDDAINRCVSILRHILSPQDKNAYIETVMRKGYIAHFPPPPIAGQPAAKPVRRGNSLSLAIAGVVVAIILFAVLRNYGDPVQQPRAPASDGPPMVAVLPFTTSSQAGDATFFTQGVHDDLLTQLAKLQSMRVISATSVGEYRDSADSLRRIGEELGADVILEGSVQIAGNRIRINTQLVDARSAEHLWAESYERDLSPAGIFDVQKDIARAIAVELNTALTPQDSKQLALVPTENMAAYRAYHQAMQYRDTLGTSLNTREYIQALEQAVALDPGFSRAWAELVSALAYTNINGDQPELTLQAEQALEQLQAIAPGSADLLIGQAAYVYYALKDYDRAHDLISLALTMTPGDVRAVQLKSWIERRQGDFDAYLASNKEALRLDPRNPEMSNLVLGALLVTHRYDEAGAEVERIATESYFKDCTRDLLRYRADRNLANWQASMDALCELHEVSDCGWIAHIANRDYPGALAALQRVQDHDEGLAISENDRNRIFTYWLMNDDDQLQQALVQWQGRLAIPPGDPAAPQPLERSIGAAMLAGIRGEADESAQLIERWLREEPIDRAERAFTRHDFCRIQGMIGAGQAAVKCIRDGLVEASFIMPFLEPYLPFYDALRDTPEFIAMVAEIDGAPR